MRSFDTWEMMVSPCIYDQLPDDELMEDCGWVLEEEHDDLDYLLSVVVLLGRSIRTRKCCIMVMMTFWSKDMTMWC